MINKRFLGGAALVVAFIMTLTGCAKTESNSDKQESNTATVEVKDIHGTVKVPVNPKNVVALDNRTFETLADWKIKLAAAPKGLLTEESPYMKDDSVKDIGDHKEPKLEVIASVNPDVVIVGQRFGSYYEDIKKLVPNAAVVDLSFDVSGEKGAPGESLLNGLKDSTTVIGQIFNKNDEAKKLIADFDKSIKNVKDSYNGKDTIMSVVVSGGEIGYSAPGKGRV